MQNTKLPSAKSLLKASEMSMSLEKPMCLDYYTASCMKECKIARDGAGGDKFLFKNSEEYTSPLKSMFKIANDQDSDDFILETQNSIYIVSGLMLS